MFNTEYYFGGGIQRSGIGRFTADTGMQQVQNIDMGESTKTQHELEVFLRSISSRFTQATYNLITHNCNNFSNEVCMFLTGRGIPSFIVELPQRIFATPNGAMFRPMIEQMMSGVNAQRGGLDPFGGGIGGASASSTTGNFASFSSPAASFASGSTKTFVAASPPSPAVLEELPLLSNDASSVSLLGNKIIKAVDATTGAAVLNEEEKALMTAVIANLASSPSTNTHFASDLGAFALLARIIEHQPACQMAALFLLRLMVLHRELPQGHETFIYALVERINTRSESFSGLPASVMAVCTLANWLSQDRNEVLGAAQWDAIIDLSMRLMTSHDKSEVRQMSVALAYNVTLSCTKENVVSGYWSSGSGDGASDELHPHALQLLCGSLEDVSSEGSKDVRRRRLAIALRITRAQRNIVASLANDLGFVDSLMAFQNSMGGQSVRRDDKDGIERGILHELLTLLRTAA